MGRVAGTLGILIAIGLTLVAGTSPSTPVPEVKGEPWSGLPADLRGKLPLNVAELPPFPEDHDALRDIGNWPKRRSFDGEPYRIQYSEHVADVSYSVSDVRDIHRGGEYTASYVPDTDRMPSGPSGRGPSYHWSADGRVMQQGYATKDGFRARGYDPEGHVVQYLYRKPAETSWISCNTPRMEVGIVWFDSTGNLVGFGLDGSYYWAGERKTQGEFHRLARAQDPWLALARTRRTSPTE